MTYTCPMIAESSKEKNHVYETDSLSKVTSGNTDLSDYLVIKTERITMALYLVSGHLDNAEPIKGQLRTQGLCLLECVQTLARGYQGQIKVKDQGERLRLLLEVAEAGGLLGKGNVRLIIEELEQILSLMNERFGGDSNRSITSEYFTDSVPVLGAKEAGGNEVHKGHKRHAIRQQVSDNVLPLAAPPSPASPLRIEQIFVKMEPGHAYSIKDICAWFTDTSAKTIQRDLGTLIRHRKIRREGERRWSRYYLTGSDS